MVVLLLNAFMKMVHRLYPSALTQYSGYRMYIGACSDVSGSDKENKNKTGNVDAVKLAVIGRKRVFETIFN